MNWKNKKVLVTGAGGFIGSHLVERLVELKTNVFALVHNDDIRIKHLSDKIKIINGDLVNLNLDIDGIDMVFHLAAFTDIAESFNNPKKAFQANTYGTFNLLHALKRFKIEKFIYLNTLGIYGVPKYLPIDENHPTIPIEPYAASKLAAENFVIAYNKAYNLPIAIARSFNVYGPRQNTNLVIARIITQALKKDTIEIGNIESTRDFIYVDDVIDALVKIAEKGNAIYNVGTGIETSVKEIIEKVSKILDKKLDIKIVNKRKVDVPRSQADITKIKKELNWEPAINLDEGLKKTIEYYKDER